MNQEQRTERLILLRLSRECEGGRCSAPPSRTSDFYNLAKP